MLTRSGSCSIWKTSSAVLSTVGAKRQFGAPGSDAGTDTDPMWDNARYACLEDTRGVLQLRGRDIYRFLQGLVSNDVWQIDKEGTSTVISCFDYGMRIPWCQEPQSMYAAKLNPKGRVQHDLIMYSTPGISRELSMFMECDQNGVSELRNMLLRYRLRASVDIEDVSSSFRVWTLFGQKACNQGDLPRDPRLHSLGARFIRPKEWEPKTRPSATSASSLRIDLWDSEEEVYGLGTSEEYMQWRILQGVGEGEVEIPKGGALPLEHNMDVLNGISWKKGCYIGQELTARTHFQGTIRKRLMPAKFSGDTPEVGADVVDRVDGKSIGKIRAVGNSWVLALLRIAPALKATADGSEPLVVKATKTELIPQIPRWWPQHWVDQASTSQVSSG